MDGEVEMVGEGKIHLQHNKFTDQNQQNFMKTHKSQEKNWSYFCGDFWIRTKNNKIKLENKEGAPKS